MSEDGAALGPRLASADEAPDKTAGEAANKTANKTANNAADEAASEAASEDKAASEMADEAASEDEAAGEMADEAAGEIAVEECYLALSPMVRRYVRRHVPLDDVDDVVQVVFLEVWRHQRRYDPARSLEAWVLGIARKRAIDHLRARGRHDRRVVPLDEAVTAAGPGRAVSELVDQAQDVRHALDALSPVQREAIELAYFGDLSQREIAERLRIPLGTIKARTARGLNRLGMLLCA